MVTVDDVRVFVRAYPQTRARCPPALAAAYVRDLLDTVRWAGKACGLVRAAGLACWCPSAPACIHGAAVQY